MFHGGCHGLVHSGEIGTFDEIRGPTVAEEEVLEFLVGDTGEDGGVVDLVPGIGGGGALFSMDHFIYGGEPNCGGGCDAPSSPIQVQHGQYCSIHDGVQKLGTMPTGRQWARLRFPITDHGDADQFGVIKHSSKRMRNRVT